ncbi:MAG: hypothetical protein ACYSTS_16450 [Planctomycetota bacterium]
MASFKKIICLVAIVCLVSLTFLGCAAERYTTKFQATPMESVNVDLQIEPQKLTGELDEQMEIENEKRRRMLLDKAKAEAKKVEAEKSSKPVLKNIGEVK